MRDPDAQQRLNQAISALGITINTVSDELADLAYAAEMLGQVRLGGRLRQAASALDEAFEAARKAHGDAVYDNFVAAEQSTFNIVQAAIAGMSMKESQ